MKKIFFAAVTMLAFTTTATAQTKESPDCPEVSLVGPGKNKIKAGNTATFKIVLPDKLAKTDLTYNWSVSNGTITSGQGTKSIEVDTKGLAGQIISAIVEISGLKVQCENTRSLIIDVVENGPRK